MSLALCPNYKNRGTNTTEQSRTNATAKQDSEPQVSIQGSVTWRQWPVREVREGALHPPGALSSPRTPLWSCPIRSFTSHTQSALLSTGRQEREKFMESPPSHLLIFVYFLRGSACFLPLEPLYFCNVITSRRRMRECCLPLWRVEYFCVYTHIIQMPNANWSRWENDLKKFSCVDVLKYWHVSISLLAFNKFITNIDHFCPSDN